MHLRNLLVGASIIAFAAGSAWAGEGKDAAKDKAAASSQTKPKSKQASSSKAAAGKSLKKEEAGAKKESK